MADYLHTNGFTYSEQEIEEAAKRKNQTIEDFLANTPDLSLKSGSQGSFMTSMNYGNIEPTVKSTPEATTPKFNHISEDEFLELSETGFGVFRKGREEVIVPKLIEIYGKDAKGNNSGIKFEQTGMGNNVKITLPGNNYGVVFNLPSADDEDGVRKAYADITDYIDSKKTLQIGVEDELGNNETKNKIYEVFTSRELKTKTTDRGIQYSQYDVSDPIFRRDENIASELASIINDTSYEFKAVNHLKSAVEVTLPNGNSKVFNVSEVNKLAPQQIIDFIETDNKGYKQTSTYKTTVAALDEKIDDLLSSYVESEDAALLLQDEKNFSKIKTIITNRIGSAGWQQLFFADKEEFKNVSRDDKSELIEFRIQEVLNNAKENLERKQTKTRIENKYDEGYNDKEIEKEIVNNTKKSFTGTDDLVKIKNTIFNLNKELDDPNITTDRRNEILGTGEGKFKIGLLQQAMILREKEEGKDFKYHFFMDIFTGERSLKSGEKSQVFDLTSKVEEKKQQLENEKITREDLKKEWLYTNLAHAQNVDDWKNKKRRFVINTKKISPQEFAKTYPDIAVQYKDGVNFVNISDARATKIAGGFMASGFLKLEGDYNSRLSFLEEISVDKEVYNKMYALNEGLYSQKQQTFGGSVVTGLKESVAGVIGKETPQDLGIETTVEEEEYAKTTMKETSGRAIGGVPKLLVDFWLANKVTAALGAVTGITRFVGGLNSAKTVVAGKRYTDAALINFIKKTNPKALKGVKPENQGAVVASWILKNKKKFNIKTNVPANFMEKATSTAIMANIEGIKMEIAMQDPLGLSGVEAPIGSSYATGVGFYAAGQIIPWEKMWTGLTGNRASLWKGMYDYLVKAPVNFEIGARAGELATGLVDDLMGKETWNNFIEHHFGDFDENLKHTVSNLIMGVTMRMTHFNKFDFKSEKQIQNLVRASEVKLENSYQREKVYNKEKKQSEWKLVKDEFGNPILKKGAKQSEVDKWNAVINMGNFRLAKIRDTREYLHPILGPLKVYNDIMTTVKNANVEGQTRIKYDYNLKQNMNYREVKPAKNLNDVKSWEKLANGKPNKTGKSIYEFTFNPNKLSPGMVPHELGHFATRKLFTEDVMYKSKWINGLMGVMDKIPVVGIDPKTGEAKEMTLLESYKNSGVWKRHYEYNRSQLKEEELFMYVAERLAEKGNLKLIRQHYGFDRIAGFLEKRLKEDFDQTTNLNTEKEIVQWLSKYIETNKMGESVIPNIKELERFVSRTKTESQRQRRIEWESKNGGGETVEKRSEDLVERIEIKEKQLITHPAFLQWKEDKDNKKYLANKEVQKIQADLKVMRENLKNMPKEDFVFGKENPIEKTINDFARKDGRMMTNAEWNARGGGKEKAMLELQKDGGVFDNIITKGLSFPVEGRSRETWLEDVKFGIEKVDKGLMGTLERFKPETDLQGNESLSAWINKQYQFRKGNIYNHYEANPLGKSLDAAAGKGKTIGDRLLADKDYKLETFETEDLSKEVIRNKRGDFKEVVKVQGERKLENELPIDNKVFNEKGGWKETIISKIPEIKNKENASYKNIGDLASNFTFDLVGAKLTSTQKKNPNDFNQVSLKNLQDFVGTKFKQPVMEEGVNKKGEKEIRQKLNEKGEPVFRTVDIGEMVADLFRDATVKFDKGVSDKIQGTSNFKRLGVLGELYHKATAKDYTIAEMKKMGYEVNPKVDKDGAYRVATGPGGNIFIRGKSKGEDITAKDVKEFLGQKPDGTFKTLTEDRSLAGKSRRLIDEIGGAITNQQVDVAVRANPEIVGEANSTRFLLNTGAGRSRKIYSEALENLGRNESAETRRAQKQEFFKGINSDEFSYLYNKYRSETKVNPLGKALRDYFTSLGPDSAFDINKARETASEMLKIGKQLEKKLDLEGVTGKLKALKTRVASKFQFQQDLNAIERDLDLTVTDAKWLFDPSKEGGIKLAQSLDAMLMEVFEKRHGKGWYEAILLLGNTTGKGIGGDRRAIYKTADDARDIVKKIDTSRKFEDISRVDSNRQGVRQALMEYIGFVEGVKNINKTKVKKAYNHGETNKKYLKELIVEIKNLYDSKKIDHRHVRAFLEVAGGPMEGIIKKSASLAIIPKGTNKELFSIFPERIFNEETKKWESNWVLEHTIPAQYVKARIYEYILSGTKEAKEAMDLTLKSFHTTFIPKRLDKVVNKLYRSELPPEFMPGMDPLEWRYYRNAHPSNFNIALENVIPGMEKTYDINPTFTHSQAQARARAIKAANAKLFGNIGLKEATAKKINSEDLNSASKIDDALRKGRKLSKKARGMSTFDFDETLIVKGKNFIVATNPTTGKKVKISSANWPIEGPKFAEQGYTFDFKDFVNVRGGVEGPLLQKMKNQIKKYGSENVFVLTARPAESATAIYAWLKSKGIEIPFKNITGLGNSTGEAKALWMLEKFSEGYNDMYFVDDALPNVKAVKRVLDQLDIKSKVQQALYSENLSESVNDITQHSLNIDSKKIFSKAEAKVRGKDIKRRRLFMPDSASDLELLLEPLYGKGKQGIKNQKWFQDNFIRHWERGINDYNTAKQTAINEYMTLRKQNKDIVKLLDKSVEGTNFTHDMAVRIYLWNKSGFKTPDLAKSTETKLVNYVKNNSKLRAYAEQFARITKQEKGLKEPSSEWWSETLAGEIGDIGRGVSRKKYIQDFIDAKNEIFSEKNLNKMESKLGTNWRWNMEEMLDRMETGRTRSSKMGKLGNEVMNYLNGSVGTIMNLNTRSATLQLISTVNFVNHAENNPLAMAKAFANQPQYWKDFVYIMNSNMLRQRRAGLKINVTEAELASAADVKNKGAVGTMKRVIAWTLKQGYLPTKIADSFAISAGGATYYRNRINKYKKEGLSTKEAEKKAWVDFQTIAERTQQSSRADLLSNQQTSFAGRLILPFANTPMQMNRIMMKNYLDIKNGRYKGYFGENSFTDKMSQVTYYGFVQSLIFAGLQTGLFALMANTEDIEEKSIVEKKVRTVNTISDSFLRGMGISGAVVSGLKNAIFEFIKQNEKGFKADYGEVTEDLLNISPLIGSKYGKMDQAGNTYKYGKKEIQAKGFQLELGSPSLEAAALTTEALFNIPINRALRKTENIQGALDSQYESWQRIMMLLGWGKWDVGIVPPKKQKVKKTEEKKKKKKEVIQYKVNPGKTKKSSKRRYKIN